MLCLTGETYWPLFIKEQFKDIRKPFTAGIELLPECNFKCIHCYEESNRQNISRRMTTEDIYRMIDILVAHDCLELFFTGGECLLHQNFFDIYKYAKKKGLLVSILTNGSLINQKHIELWKDYPVELVSITMYGASEKTYEKVTKNRKGYKMFCNAVKLLKENNIPFEIKCIGMNQNFEDISQIRKFTREQGLKNAILAWDIRPMNNGDKAPICYRVSPEDAFKKEIEDPERRKFWEELAFNEKLFEPTKKQIEGKLYPCEIGNQFVFITQDGYMQGCVKAVEPRYDLINGDFDEGWEFLKTEFVEKKASKDFICLHCNKFRFCGQCTAAFQIENGNPETPVKFYCELAELELQYIKKIQLKHTQNISAKTI